MSNVFVTDSQMRSSLAVIRSLGKKGLNVTAGEETRFATGSFSKYCKNKVVYPSPKEKNEEFVSYLLDLIRKGNFDVLFPVADACLKPIIDNEKEFSEYTKIALPPKNIFMNGYDKASTIKIALENNIPCPKTYFVTDPVNVYDIGSSLNYPVVIKPTVSSGKRGVVICNSPEELFNNCKIVHSNYGELLVQEFIPNGGEFGVYALFNYNSEPRAFTVQRRIRSYPVSGGPSTLRETFKNETSKKAIVYAFDLLRAMKWVGVAMVEFRIDARDGVPRLMEVNPRFWGSLQLSILGGVDFPYLLYKMIMNGDVEPVLDYKENIKCRWLLPGDILWFLSAPNKFKNLPEFLDTSIPDDIISWNDPGPTFGFSSAVLRYLFDKEMWKFVLRR
jgi:predicted ATP-grasp superfamily ATP-dependent carboligase